MKKREYPASVPVEQMIVGHLKKDAEFAAEYLKVALEEAEEEGGHFALLQALKYIAEARGVAKVAKAAGIPRESLYRILSPKGNPRLDTFLAVIRGMGMQLTARPIRA